MLPPVVVEVAVVFALVVVATFFHIDTPPLGLLLTPEFLRKPKLKLNGVIKILPR